MGRMVNLDDLVDAAEIAELVGFNSPTAVSVYLSRGSFPKPVIDRGGRRARLWLRQDIIEWEAKRKTSKGRSNTSKSDD
jgi:predicted DNA-binding transcriptional regulator AlpA